MTYNTLYLIQVIMALWVAIYLLFKKNMSTMSEKLCLKWNDFQDNINATFGKLRNDQEFSDVTLACEDGQQVEAHKVIVLTPEMISNQILWLC